MWQAIKQRSHLGCKNDFFETTVLKYPISKVYFYSIYPVDRLVLSRAPC